MEEITNRILNCGIEPGSVLPVLKSIQEYQNYGKYQKWSNEDPNMNKLPEQNPPAQISPDSEMIDLTQDEKIPEKDFEFAIPIVPEMPKNDISILDKNAKSTQTTGGLVNRVTVERFNER